MTGNVKRDTGQLRSKATAGTGSCEVWTTVGDAQSDSPQNVSLCLGLLLHLPRNNRVALEWSWVLRLNDGSVINSSRLCFGT